MDTDDGDGGEGPARLDLSGYDERERALALAAHGCPDGYTAVARRHMAAASELSLDAFLFSGFVSRLRGLHEGVVREIAASNPHTVLPLTRAWAETVAVGAYTIRNPRYAEVLLHGPGPDRPARKSFEAIFHAIKDDFGGMRDVYRELSAYTHFGPRGVWGSLSIESEEEGAVSWTDAPRWRDERHFQVACAQAHELAVAGLETLDRLGPVLVPSGDAAADVGDGRG